MARNSGIRKRGERWVARGYDPSKGGGSSWQRTFDSLEEARAAKVAFEAGKRRQSAAQETCDEFAARWTSDAKWLDHRQASTNMHNRYQIRAFVEDFAGVPLADVDLPTARAWIVGGTMPQDIERTAKRWAGVTRNPQGRLVGIPHHSSLGAVRAMFTDARLEGSVASNPFTGLRVPGTKGRKEIEPLTESEVALLARLARDEWDGAAGRMLSAFIIVSGYTGLRPGEMYEMRWDWIDWQSGTIEVRGQYRTKTREHVPYTKHGELGERPRLVVAPERALEALRSLPPAASPSDHVFLTPRGRPLMQRTHYYYWRPVAARWRAAVDGTRRDVDVDPYWLRHFCGSMLADRGATAGDIAYQLGHKDGGALAQRLYIHTYRDRARDRLRDAFGREPEAESRPEPDSDRRSA